MSKPAWPAPMTTVCVEVGRLAGTTAGYAVRTVSRPPVDGPHRMHLTVPHPTDLRRDQGQGVGWRTGAHTRPRSDQPAIAGPALTPGEGERTRVPRSSRLTTDPDLGPARN